MAGDELFDELPEQSAPPAPEGAARLRRPVRNQLEFRSVDVDSLLPLGHRARVMWAYVEKLDLSALYQRVKAREGRPGHPPHSQRYAASLLHSRSSSRALPTPSSVAYSHSDIRIAGSIAGRPVDCTVVRTRPYSLPRSRPSM